MKRYEVVVTPEAELSIRESLQYLLADSPDEAARWLGRLYAKIDTLETFPERRRMGRERAE